jgi:hypothetical protein
MDRLAIVKEHVQFENAHDLDGIMGTFGSEARYDDEPWSEHHLGRDQVRSYYETLLKVAPDLKIDVQKHHVTDEAVILEVVISGTQRGHEPTTLAGKILTPLAHPVTVARALLRLRA